MDMPVESVCVTDCSAYWPTGCGWEDQTQPAPAICLPRADAGDLVFKPRDQWHTFWNAGDGPCRILEIISPGGFEHSFDQMATAMASPNFDPQQMAELAGRYGIEMQPDSIPMICAEHGLTHPMLAASD